jgi:hypothetical protein
LKAATLDVDPAEAHTSPAVTLRKYDFDWAGAERVAFQVVSIPQALSILLSGMFTRLPESL